LFHKWSDRPAQIPQGLKPLNSPALFGTTEVVPFHETIYETRSSEFAVCVRAPLIREGALMKFMGKSK
jgi:hypothetical protein